jgi:formate dehydrogenase gamma subunit
MLLVALAGVAVAAHGESGQTEPSQPSFENYQKYIGRELVTNDRGVNAGLHRPLPLSCPPFNLRDENGEIIDPTKDVDGKPIDANTPKEKAGIPRPISMKQTCSPCHDYNKITHGYHFQMGRDELKPDLPADQGVSRDRSPGLFGKWSPLYQRELMPKHFSDADAVDMTPFDWVVNCGLCHPGGGPAEYDRNLVRYDKALAQDQGGLTMFGDGDYADSAWTKTGVMEADCFICHLETYEYSARAQQIKKLNFKYAATAASGIGFVFGSNKEGKDPKVYYNRALFNADNTISLKIRRPADRACTQCHDMSSAAKRGTSWHSSYVQDVHTQKGIGCTDCHPGDIRHNFAKGSSSSQTVRDDLDNTNHGCKQCHERGERGAPRYDHPGFPPLHLERIACEACHITHRPFTPAGTIDSISGKAMTLAAQTDPKAYDCYKFGAMWGNATGYDKENLLTPFTAEQLETAASLIVDANSPLRGIFTKLVPPPADKPDEKAKVVCRLPDNTFTVREFVEQKGLTFDDARGLMLEALRLVAPAKGASAVCVYRGEGWKSDRGQIEKIAATLQPRKPGSTIAESPYTYGRDKKDGLIHPENSQLGVFWAYMDKTQAQPLFLKDMKAAWDFLNSDEYKLSLYTGGPASGVSAQGLPRTGEAGEKENEAQPAAAPAPAEGQPAAAPAAQEAPAQPEAKNEPSPQEIALAKEGLVDAMREKLKAYSPTDPKKLMIYDDNNDTFPEVNTEEEMALFGWAIKQTCPRVKDKDLFFIKGENAWKVSLESWVNPYDVDLLKMDRIGENEPFILIERREQQDVNGASSWDKPTKQWVTVETRMARPYKAVIAKLDKAAYPAIGELATALPWTASHGVEPAGQALGAKGCTDCHGENTHFFFGRVAVDPFGPDGTPETKPMYALLGYLPSDLEFSEFRESILKPYGRYLVLIVLAMILLHFVVFGAKDAGKNFERNVLRFRLHERFWHFVSMSTVVFLAVTGFCFLLGKSNPLGPLARQIHTYVGYAATVGLVGIFLGWFIYMFPAKGDLTWLMKAGGYLGGVKGHLPAGKFNAGQKILFWIIIACCGTLAATGITMGLFRGAHFAHQEIVYTVHDTAALLMVILLMAHIYLGAVVVSHSLNAVFGGKVGDEWAKQHHSNWRYEIEKD